jgi:hypothetical protein
VSLRQRVNLRQRDTLMPPHLVHGKQTAMDRWQKTTSTFEKEVM